MVADEAMAADPTHAAVTADGRTVLLPHIVGDEYGADIGEDATDAELRAFVAVSAPDRDWTAWRVGDAARFLQQRHGDDWPEYMPDTGHAPKTWRNYLTVALAWRNRSCRREWTERGLSHGHLAAVASIAARDAAAADAILADAAELGWSVSALRAAVKGDPDPRDEDEMEATALGGCIRRAIRDWMEDEGLTLFSDGQLAHLTSTVLEAVRTWERHVRPRVPFEPEPEGALADEDGEALPYDVAYTRDRQEAERVAR